MYYSEFCSVVLPHCHVVATGEAIAWCGISLQDCWYKGPSPLVSSYNTDGPETKKIKHVVLLLSDLSISKCVSAHLTKGKVNIFYPFFSVLSLNSTRYKYSTRFVTKSLIMLVANLICLLFGGKSEKIFLHNLPSSLHHTQKHDGWSKNICLEVESFDLWHKFAYCTQFFFILICTTI